MKTLIAILLLSMTGCIAEQNKLKEQVRLLEIKQEEMYKELDLDRARMEEIAAEQHKCECK